VKISWTLKWTKHHWFSKCGLGCCISDLKLVITCWACFYVKKLIYAHICECFMILLISSHMYVLIFKTCPSMTNICTTTGIYTKSFDNQFSRGFQVSFIQIWPDISSKSKITRHVQPLARTYPADQTYVASQPDIFDARANRYKSGVHTPSNPGTPISSPLQILVVPSSP
jgi:hypothetical protein